MPEQLLMTNTAALATAAALAADIAALEGERLELAATLAGLLGAIDQCAVTAALTQTAPPGMGESHARVAAIEARLRDITATIRTLQSARDIRLQLADEECAEAQVRRTLAAIESRDQACTETHSLMAELVGRLQTVARAAQSAAREVSTAKAMQQAGTMTDEQLARAIPPRVTLPAHVNPIGRSGVLKPEYEYTLGSDYLLATLREKLQDTIAALATGESVSALLEDFIRFDQFRVHGNLPTAQPVQRPARMGDMTGMEVAKPRELKPAHLATAARALRREVEEG